MKDYREMTEKLYPVPACVQELIPVYRISKDGVFQLEKKTEGAEILFDKAYLFLDTNFAAMDDFEKEDFLKLYCPVLNAMNVSFKVIVMNNNQDMEKIRGDIFIRNRDGHFTELIHAINRHVEEVMQEGHSGIEQIRLMVITCRRKSAEQARDYFRSVESGIAANFKRMKSGLIPLDATERLRYLHAFYNLGQESRFQFNFDRALHRKTDWKDLLAPRTIRHWQNEYGDFDGITVQIDNRFVRALYAPAMPNSINTDILQHLMSGTYHVIITQDIAPVPQDVVRKRLMDLYMQTGRSIEKQQEARNKAMQWTSPISYDKRKEMDELNEYMDIINENDEKMFYLGLYAVITADSKTELDNAVVAFCAAAQGEGFRFEPAYWKQLDAINTALPVGCRFVNHMYPLFTQPLAAITPFITHELCEKDGIFYGINQISKNVLVGNRKNLMNGNGFILGSTGAGKGFETKNELVQVKLRYPEDDIIVIDPQNEYREMTEYLNGQFVDFGADGGQHINPLDVDTLDYMENKKAFLQDKSELLLSIFSQVLEGGITAQDKSLLVRCLTDIYSDLPEHSRGRKYTPPTLTDLYRSLVQQHEERAAELALALELFLSGGLDMFAHQTNINIRNHFVVYGIANLGKEQSAVGMIVMLESIRSRIAGNAKRGRATWLFIDEFHNLAGNEYSAIFLEKIWKEVRKLGGLCTAITQNISDLLMSKTVETMLMNSEYINLLSQKPKEVSLFQEVIGVTSHLLQYVCDAPSGCGLLKFGDRYIPKDNRLPKDSLMYQLYNTNFHEIQKQKNIRKEAGRLPNLVRQVIDSEPTEGELIYP